MNYSEAAAKAPPGWRHFTLEDIERLPAAVRHHEMLRVPRPERDRLVASDPRAAERLRRAFFWTLVYHLEPERWDELARAEPIQPDLLRGLPEDVSTGLDVAAGSGRLTQHLACRCRRVVAIEPSAGLGLMIRARLPSVGVVAAWAEALPVASHTSQLTAACGFAGPDPELLAELRRVTAPGGCIALISPENPQWFEDQGWSRYTMGPAPAPAHARWIDDFFGPPDPPRELVMLRVR